MTTGHGKRADRGFDEALWALAVGAVLGMLFGLMLWGTGVGVLAGVVIGILLGLSVDLMADRRR